MNDDAVAGLHGAPHRLLQTELEPDVEVAELRAERPQRILDHLPYAGAFLHHDQRLVRELVERDRAAGERDDPEGRRGSPRRA